MYIRRRSDGNGCPLGVASCSPSYAIIGPDPQQQDNDDTFGPINYGKPGPHRFIGIAMVAGLIFIGLTVYCIIGRRPKQLRRKYCRCLGGHKDEEMDEETSMKQVSIVLETHSSASYSSDEKRRDSRISSTVPGTDPSSKSHQKQSRHSRSSRRHERPKSSRRAGGASVVHVAKDSRDDAGEQAGNLVSRWDIEHVQGVRYQVRTPKSDGSDQKVQVHLQKPHLAYQR